MLQTRRIAETGWAQKFHTLHPSIDVAPAVVTGYKGGRTTTIIWPRIEGGLVPITLAGDISDP